MATITVRAPAWLGVEYDAAHVTPNSSASWSEGDLLTIAGGTANKASAGTKVNLVLAYQDFPDSNYEGTDGRVLPAGRFTPGEPVIINLTGGAGSTHTLSAADIGASYGFTFDTATGYPVLNSADTSNAAFKVQSTVGAYYGNGVGEGDVGDTNARVVATALSTAAY